MIQCPRAQAAISAASGLMGGEIGDRVDGLRAPLLRPEAPMLTADAHDLTRVREEQPLDGDDLHLPLLLAAMSTVMRAVKDRRLGPGQVSQLPG
jgi:hypothetical protein